MNTMFLSDFNWYGLIMATGIVLGVIGAYFAAKHHGMEGDVIIDMILICLPLAIIGARVYHVVFDSLNPAGHKWTFAEFCGFSGGEFVGLSGLAIYGGLIGALGGAGIFHLVKTRKSLPPEKRVTFLQICDVGFTFIMLGQIIARWGNFTNGEAYGEVITNPMWQWAPFGMKVDGQWRYSMWFFESLWNFFGFFILLYLYLGRYKSFDGFVFACYGIYYGIGRSWIEAIRVNDVLYLGGMRVSVVVSVLFIIMGVAIIAQHIIRAKRAGKKIFICIDRKKLSDEYFEYEKTKLAHPMPDINPKKSKKAEVVVDSSGVAVKLEDETSEQPSSEPQKPEKPTKPAKPAKPETEPTESEENYEDKWD